MSIMAMAAMLGIASFLLNVALIGSESDRDLLSAVHARV